MPERILITGAQGLLGRYVTAHCLASNPSARVLGIGRSAHTEEAFTHELCWSQARLRAPLPSPLRGALGDPRFRYRPLDLNDRRSLSQMLGETRPDVVFHLAAALRDEPIDRLLDSNIRATLSLLEAVAEAGVDPPLVVLASSGGVYGAAPTSMLPLREDAAGVPVDLYSASKRAAEDVARIAAERHDIPLILARVFNVVGPGQDERHVCARLVRQLAEVREGLRPPVIDIGPLDPTRDFIDARDAAHALWLISALGEPGTIYNVGSGRETSIGEVLAHALDVSGCGDSVRIEHRLGRAAGVLRHFADITRLRELGFQPEIPLRRSLGDLFRYYVDTVASAPLSDGPRDAPSHCLERTSLAVRVEAAHSYSIEIEAGLLARLPAILSRRFPGARMVILTDDGVEPLYGASLVHRLRQAGVSADPVVLGAGEESKSFESYRYVIDRLHAYRFDRRALLVNLGGGLITDLGGFVAATYMRGVAYVNVPTTLLAQHDSAIGGKVAINLPWSKNFVGAFHHPRAVYCDPQVLVTLGARDLAAGVAEAVKVAVIGDGDLFDLLADRVSDIRDGRDPLVLAEVVRRAAARKITLLSADPYENDLRRVLNLGHTFGHALEVELNYEGIKHGEAVAFGLAVATAVAEARGVCDLADADRIYSLLDSYCLPPIVERSRLSAVSRRLEEIRLVRGNELFFVLPERIGSVIIVPEVNESEIDTAIETISRHPVLSRAVA